MSFRYCVLATLKDESVLAEYIAWLSGGHCQAVVDRGGAINCTVSVLHNEAECCVESAFLFPSKEAYDTYCSGVALELRPEGVALWVDTGKVKFGRSTGDVQFKYGSSL
jgi:hypothetical protein